MTKVFGWLALGALLLGGVCPMIHADPATVLHIDGAVAKPMDWTASDLEKSSIAPVQTIHYTLDGASHTAKCVPLLAVVQAAKPDFNSHIKNHQLQFIVAVTGFDGYTVDFSLAELLPHFGNHPVWIALDQDGQPLTGEATPVGLIAPDDVKPGRWVHGIAKITVIDGAQIGEAAKSGTN